MGPYCKFCNFRCFVPDPKRAGYILATCERGKAEDRKFGYDIDMARAEVATPEYTTRVDMIDRLAREIVADHLATRFEESAAWSRPGQSDIPQSDADAIAARANVLMDAVADAFANSAPTVAAKPRCRHEESLYGRCVTCGRTWEEQDRDRAANAEPRV